MVTHALEERDGNSSGDDIFHRSVHGIPCIVAVEDNVAKGNCIHVLMVGSIFPYLGDSFGCIARDVGSGCALGVADSNEGEISLRSRKLLKSEVHAIFLPEFKIILAVEERISVSILINLVIRRSRVVDFACKLVESQLIDAIGIGRRPGEAVSDIHAADSSAGSFVFNYTGHCNIATNRGPVD